MSVGHCKRLGKESLCYHWLGAIVYCLYAEPRRANSELWSIIINKDNRIPVNTVTRDELRQMNIGYHHCIQ